MPHRQRLRAGLAVTLGMVLTGCAKNAPQDYFRPAGKNARDINNLQVPVFIIAGVVGVIVMVLIAFIVFKFKDRGQDIPEQTHGNPKLEIALTILPALILAGVAVPTVVTVFKLDKKADTQCIVDVTGQQWWWEYDYVSGPCGPLTIGEPIVTAGELVIPTKTNVLLRITSRDVIHSFWIPRLNGKRDAVPGRIGTVRLEADQPGIYTGQCTEFCGLSHARMRMAAVALDAADFQTWVSNQQAPYSPATGDLATQGETVFTNNCAKCHQVNGLNQTSKDANGKNITVPVLSNPDLYVVSGVAPNLSKLMTRTAFAGWTFDLLTDECRTKLWNAAPQDFGALYLKGITPDCFNETNLRSWLRNPPGLKPMYVDPTQLGATKGKYRGMPNLHLTEAQIDQLIAYLLQRK
jgi:cytochrome c oxidase subunit 2